MLSNATAAQFLTPLVTSAATGAVFQGGAIQNIGTNMQQSYGFHPGQDVQIPDANADPNSPELFKQNLGNVQREVIRLQTLARDALAGSENAYQLGYSPENTAQTIAELKSALKTLIQSLRTTGVGALPLLPAPVQAGSPRVPPSEPELLDGTNQLVKALYESLQKKQDSAGVVANLLGSPEIGQQRK